MLSNHPLDDIPDSFWQTIEVARKDQDQLIAAVNSMSRDQLLEFIWTFQEVAAEFKYEPYTDYVSPELSEDGIDDVASWVVEQGKESTYSVFDNPSRMPERVDHPLGFLSKAVRAFYKRFGGPIPLRP
ncbi:MULTISPECIES: DUF4240 domain-containing protein [unclassified Microbulbifer]|uniref:DUF4240 domain-containing protein n=1 Tax=unclassified Microbulbifer TaxID=2619833 RepID=UPI0027E56D3F|nr:MULTISPECIES: DUF4240 domain-containing protein [unclassified Microbulbifer]